MGDSWVDLSNRITEKTDELRVELQEQIEVAKRDAIFEAIRKLEAKVDILAARLPEVEEVN